MPAPKHIKAHETDLSTMWFDDDGIFYSVSKPYSKVDLEGMKKTFDYINQNKKTEKICWLGDVTNTSPADKDARKHAAQETPKFVKALALITNSPLSKTLAELYLMVVKPGFPTKMFTNKEEAKKWLKQHL